MILQLVVTSVYGWQMATYIQNGPHKTIYPYQCNEKRPMYLITTDEVTTN